MSSKKLSRKEIKETVRHDEVQTAVVTAVEEIKTHQKGLTILGVGIVAIALLTVVFWNVRKASHAESNEALAQAMRVYHAPVVETDAKPDDPKTPSFASEADRTERAKTSLAAVSSGVPAEVASLYAANLEIDDDAGAARQRWEDFLGANEGHVLAFAVHRNLIRLDRAEGRGEEVVERLTAELDKTEKSLPEEIVLFELAQTLEVLDRDEEAKEYYQRLLDDYPESPFTTEAQQKTS